MIASTWPSAEYVAKNLSYFSLLQSNVGSATLPQDHVRNSWLMAMSCGPFGATERTARFPCYSDTSESPAPAAVIPREWVRTWPDKPLAHEFCGQLLIHAEDSA